MAVQRNDPYPGLNFEVVIEGISEDGLSARGGFAEVSGLEIEVVPIEYRTGGEINTVRKVPGLTKFSNITLKRGVIGDITMWNWIKTVFQGQVHRADGRITLFDESRQPVMTWRFRRGWPCKLSGPTFNATSNEVAIEILEIAHEGIEAD